MSEKIKKETAADQSLLEEKLDKLISLQEEQITLLKMLANDRCTCDKHKKDKGEKWREKSEKWNDKGEKWREKSDKWRDRDDRAGSGRDHDRPEEGQWKKKIYKDKDNKKDDEKKPSRDFRKPWDKHSSRY